jgi:glycosyltransferase involved in cell wall biosynthesis
VAAADRYTQHEIDDARFELTGGFPNRPVLCYVGRWSAEKRMHLLVRCRPPGVSLAFVGDGPMKEVIEEWHDPPRVVVLPGTYVTAFPNSGRLFYRSW